MQRISINDLRERAALHQKMLKESGFDINISPYFAYSLYGYHYNYYSDGVMKQEFTGLGTKRECFERMNKAYYKILESQKEGDS